MKTKTRVVFRKWPNGDILALFPLVQDYSYFCLSYQHIGQHGGADYTGCISSTKPATSEEYADLETELQFLGYSLQIRTRSNTFI